MLVQTERAAAKHPKGGAACPQAAERENERSPSGLGSSRSTSKRYAVQEFCTYRFGLLSEGALQGCEVVCPWHNSRFDLASGKVTHGPAKVAVRTFRVETREGKIWVEARRPR